MTASHHDPRWPDKVLFASVLLMLAGLVGLLFDLLVLGGATVEGVPGGILEFYPLALRAPLNVATVAFGLLGFRHQAARWVIGGSVTAIFSLGMFGIVPILGVFALIFLLKAWREGEELHDDGITYAPSMWPDKAILASLLFFVAAVVTAAHVVVLATGDWAPGESSSMWAFLGGAAVPFLLAGARDSFLQRRTWTGWFGGGMGIVALGFYAIGPLLAAAGLLFLLLAEREDEFRPAVAA